MSINDPAPYDPENEGTETFEGTLRRVETGDALAHEQGKEWADKTARKAKSKSNPPWFTLERIAPLWKIIVDQFTWKNFATATKFLLDRFNEWRTWGLSAFWRTKAKKTEAEAEEISSRVEINRAVAKRENAVADSIAEDTALKKDMRKFINKKLKEKRKNDPKSDVIKPSDQFLQQLQDDGVAYEVKRDKQGRLVFVVTKILPEEYPSE